MHTNQLFSYLLEHIPRNLSTAITPIKLEARTPRKRETPSTPGGGSSGSGGGGNSAGDELLRTVLHHFTSGLLQTHKSK